MAAGADCLFHIAKRVGGISGNLIVNLAPGVRGDGAADWAAAGLRRQQAAASVIPTRAAILVRVMGGLRKPEVWRTRKTEPSDRLRLAAWQGRRA
jgi:hypothetical protein